MISHAIVHMGVSAVTRAVTPVMPRYAATQLLTRASTRSLRTAPTMGYLGQKLAGISVMLET